MPKNIKHYILVAITLGTIGLASAGLIGVANLLTRDQIAQNEANKVKEGLNFIYGSNSTYGEYVEKEFGKYCVGYYEVKDSSDASIGKIFRTTGANMYGKIAMLVGVNEDLTLGKIYLVTNEQSYATTLVDNYVDPFNAGNHEFDDVKVGATYGATLVHDMANEAIEYATSLKGGE